MINKLLSFLHIKEFLDKLNSYNEEKDIRFRIVDADEKTGWLKIQIKGVLRFFESPARKVMESDMLMYFSKQDAIMITHLGTKHDGQTEKLKYKFIKLNASIGSKNSSITVEDEYGNFQEKDCYEALFDIELVKTATDLEKIKIGYIAGWEQYQRKRENI